MSLDANRKIDILTFHETEKKPYALAQGAHAFEVFQPHLEALVLDAIYNILKVNQRKSIAQLLKKEESFDTEYHKKVVSACISYTESLRSTADESTQEQTFVEEEEEKNAPSENLETGGSFTDTVELQL